MGTRLTHNEYVERVKNAHNNIEIIGRFTKTSEKIKAKCLDCGNVWEARASSLFYYNCPVCAQKQRAASNTCSTDKFKEKLAKVNQDVELLTEYKGSHKKITVKCLICQNIYDVAATNLLSGERCPVCMQNQRAKKRGLPKEIFLERIQDNKLKITLLSEYKNLSHEIDVKCDICGRTWKTFPKQLLKAKYGCSVCAKKINGELQRFTQEQFEEIVHNANPTMKIIGDYQGCEATVKVQCTKCGHIWNGYAKTLMTSGSWCPECLKKYTIKLNTIDQEAYVKSVYEFNPDVEIISNYHGGKKKITLRCRKCKAEWECWAAYAKTALCPNCNPNSQGENIIKEYLESHNIEFVAQKKFADLVGTRGGKLSYDFFIPYYRTLIEFQGLQHYKSIDFYGGDKKYIQQKHHDKLKFDYAMSHGYKLLTIPYYEFGNIETILRENLKTS